MRKSDIPYFNTSEQSVENNIKFYGISINHKYYTDDLSTLIFECQFIYDYKIPYIIPNEAYDIGIYDIEIPRDNVYISIGDNLIEKAIDNPLYISLLSSHSVKITDIGTAVIRFKICILPKIETDITYSKDYYLRYQYGLIARTRQGGIIGTPEYEEFINEERHMQRIKM